MKIVLEVIGVSVAGFVLYYLARLGAILIALFGGGTGP